MNKFWTNSAEYTILNHNGLTTVTAKVFLPTFNRIVLMLLALVFCPVFVLGVFWMMVSNSAPIVMYIIWLSLSVFLGMIGFFGYKQAVNPIVFLLVINKNDKTIRVEKEHFTTSFDEIQKVTIGEHVSYLGATPLLKFSLTSGEKTIQFPLESYDKAKEIKLLLDQAIQK